MSGVKSYGLTIVGTKWYIIHLLFYHLPSSTDMLFEAHF
jgi:hypothetical protein